MRFDWWKRLRLSTQLVLGFVVMGAIPLSLITIITFENAKNYLEDAVTDRILAIASHKTQRMKSFLNERIVDVTTLARMPSIIEAMEKFDAAFKIGQQIYSVEYMTIEQELKPFLTDYKESSRYGDLFLISPQGDTIFSVNRTEELGTNLITGLFQDTALAKAFDRARTLLETGISDFEPYLTQHRAAAFLAAPVFRQGTFLGVVALEVTDKDILNLIQDNRGLGQTGEVVIAYRRPNGALLVSPLRHEPRTAFNTLIPFNTDVAYPIQLAVQGKHGSGLSYDFRGERVLAAWDYLPSYRWGIVVKINAEEAFSPIAKLKTITLLSGSLLMMVLAVGAFFIGNNMSKPLTNLVNQTKRFRRQDFSHRVPESGPQEVSVLAGAFNEMAQELNQSYSELKNNLGELSKANNNLAREMAERQRAEESLKQKEHQIQNAQRMEAIGTLAGGIAHDFNNVLGAILGYTELAIRGIPSHSRAQDHLQEVMVAGQRAKHLVRQILTFSRQSDLEQQLVDLKPIIQEVVQLLRATLPSTIEITHHLNEEVGFVFADPTQMHQVLINLCTNAEYALRPDGGMLEIGLEPFEVTEQISASHPELKPGPHIALIVHDTGCGIPSEVAKRIFDPFFTTKGVGEGTGMGLAVVHGIVTNHHGTITVDSTPGSGTTFTIHLPCCHAPHTERAEPDRTPIPKGTGSILFVDDEETLAKLGKQVLEELGYDAIVCTNSLEALDLFRATPTKFAAVITDQTMPHMTGDNLAKECLRIRPDLLVILCTGYSHSMTPDKANHMGIRAFLMKPIQKQELGLILHELLHQPNEGITSSTG